jgi:hypothetical protein
VSARTKLLSLDHIESYTDNNNDNDNKVKLSQCQAVKAYRVEMLKISHCQDNLLTDGGRVTLCTGLALLPRNIIFLLLILISVRGRVNPRA